MIKTYLIYLGFGLMALTSASSYSAWSADIYVYRNSKNKEDVSLDSVRNVFESKLLTWKTGKNIVLVVSDFKQIDDEIFESFSSMTKGQFLTRWRVKFFSGRARMPVQVHQDEEALKLLRENPEAVFYSFRQVSGKEDLEGLREDRFSF